MIPVPASIQQQEPQITSDTSHLVDPALPAEVQPHKLDVMTRARLLEERRKELAARGHKPESAQKQFDDDFEHGRTQLRELSEIGSSALSSLFDLAQQTDNPRVFEVLAGLINTVATVNKDLVGLHEQKVKHEKLAGSGGSGQEGPGVGITNNSQTNVIFTGTNADLNSMLEKLAGQKPALKIEDGS